MRWLAVHLPDLPLEVHTRGLGQSLPLAVSHSREGQRILRCNPPAVAQGVRPGQLAGAARALVETLRILPRDPVLERAALAGIAVWAGRFSALVSLDPPRSLVLEAGRSLALFKGPGLLVRRVSHGLRQLGYRAVLTLAPTPAGALLLAGRGQGGIFQDLEALRPALATLPLDALPSVDDRSATALRSMGLTTLGDLLRLPRSGLLERLGVGPVQWFLRALGELPDPRQPFQSPPRFSSRVQLPVEVADAGALLFAARRLLMELGGFLSAREAGVQGLEWRLLHAPERMTCFRLGVSRATRDAGHLLRLLRERLERLDLPEPVCEIGLRAAALQPLEARTPDLFAARGGRQQETAEWLLERLRARLGRDAVTGLTLMEDHRPERAWVAGPPGRSGRGQGRGDRPLWLLPAPVPLRESGGWPWHADGRLELDAERERIESGWWDGQEVARDYFVARTCRGERLWIFRELGGRHRWFLHGWFGWFD